MFRIISKLLDLLSFREKKHLSFLVLALLGLAFIEMAGIASIMPFMAVVANPEFIHENKWLGRAYEFLGFSNERDFLFFLGMLVLSLLVFSNLFKAMTTWLTLRYDNRLNYMMGRRLLHRYLNQPYQFFLNRNTAVLGKNVLNEVRNVIAGVLSPCMQVLAGTMIIVFIFALLLIVNPFIAMSIAAVLGGAYTGIYLLVRHRLAFIGQEQLSSNAMKFKAAGEALSGIKDIKILGREWVFLNRFAVHAERQAGHNVTAGVISQIPRYALEILAFGGILLIVLYFLKSGHGAEQMVPLMALYAFAGYRLLPALQQVFSGIASVRYSLAALDLLHRDLLEKRKLEVGQALLGRPAERPPLAFERELEIRDLTFSYPETHDPAIKNISLSILPNSTIGLVGTTGSGKTTLVDLILGLLTSTSGQIFVDGIELSDANMSQWQRNLGYVPQQIYLCDDTMINNIAFGVPESEIDMEAVVRAARIANLHTFIEQELAQGYETVIGDRGIRLSGGQRQRIGIARALYRDPAVLVMDEATSALDGITEVAVMDAIRTLSGEKTIILIAHRLTTVKDCDVIYLLEHGRIIAQGDYVSLQKSSHWFRAVGNTTTEGFGITRERVVR